jgi:hypothetical protein
MFHGPGAQPLNGDETAMQRHVDDDDALDELKAPTHVREGSKPPGDAKTFNVAMS